MLRIALPNKGRLMDETRELFQDAGLEVRASSDRALIASLGGEFEALFVRTQDIPEFVAFEQNQEIPELVADDIPSVQESWMDVKLEEPKKVMKVRPLSSAPNQSSYAYVPRASYQPVFSPTAKYGSPSSNAR